uniref:Integrase catalytic domain-containing protein n=1 Tax=Esox lucius TaxID=8010 RepID=A0A6Q2ZFK3_ESOLU
MKDMCKMLNIKQRFHVPYRPQAAGFVERQNHFLKELIAKQIAQPKIQWIDALPTVLTVIRATPSRATGISPYKLMTGRAMWLPIDPEVKPADLGPLLFSTQHTVLKQIQNRLKVQYALATLRNAQSHIQSLKVVLLKETLTRLFCVLQTLCVLQTFQCSVSIPGSLQQG